MPGVLDPFQFVLIAVTGWMNQRQLRIIDYPLEENRDWGYGRIQGVLSNLGHEACSQHDR